MIAEETKLQSDVRTFQQMGGHIDEFQLIDESNPGYDMDPQYVFMNDWCFNSVIKERPKKHTDVASQVPFLFYLSNFVPIEFVDIRNPGIDCARLRYIKGDITNLPFENDSIESLSCLHVAEHIGLGRYGDKVDPKGFSKACQELKRVLRPGGILYFSVPTGIPKVVFNAHRVIGRDQVQEEFSDLCILDYSAIGSNGWYKQHASKEYLDADSYGCGLWKFTK